MGRAPSGGVCGGELRRYSLVNVAISWWHRLLEQPSERDLPRHMVERIRRLAQSLAIEKALFEAGHSVSGHHHRIQNAQTVVRFGK
jgi:hypothetical protein